MAGRQHGQPGGDAALGVTELYGAHAVSMIRIALIMLGDRAAAEDVVQDAFFGLYRRWSKLDDPANAELRQAMLDEYLPKQGPAFETWLDSADAVGARIVAEKMFTFAQET